MPARLPLLVFGVLASIAWAQTPAPDRQHDEAELRRIKTELWPGFFRRQDVKGLEDFLAPGFVTIAEDGQVTERAAVLEGVSLHPWNPANFRYTIDRFAWLDDDQVIIVGRGESDRSNDAGQPCRHGYASSNLLRRAPQAPLGWEALSSHVSGESCVAQ